MMTITEQNLHNDIAANRAKIDLLGDDLLALAERVLALEKAKTTAKKKTTTETKEDA